MRRVPRIAVAVSLALASGACASRVGPDTAATDATAETIRDGVGQPLTFTFVVDRLDIDLTDNPDVPHTGFDLDDLFSADVDPGGCTHPDYFSAFDDDQHCANVVNERCATSPNTGCYTGDANCRGGVDNQLPTLANTIQTAANTDIRVTIADSIAHNENVILVRVTGVDDVRTDTHVRVAFYRAFPRFSDGCDRVDPGREYSVDRASLTGGNDIDANALVAFDGSIVAGRLRVARGTRSTVFDMQIDFSGYRLHLPMRAITFRADLGSAALERSALGGWVLADDIIAQNGDHTTADYVSAVRGVIGGLVDVQVDGVCDGSGMNPARYGAISLGFGVHAVPALISTTVPIADAREIGVCGSTMSDAGSGG